MKWTSEVIDDQKHSSTSAKHTMQDNHEDGHDRYYNVVPELEHRAPCSLGYVNASLVRLPTSLEGKEADDGGGSVLAEYVVAQGPLLGDEYFGAQDTRARFWTCVVENNVGVVVALAPIGGRETADYVSNGVYGPWQVHCESQTAWLDGAAVRRELRVTAKSGTGFPAEFRECTVTHIHFLAWPNYGVAPAHAVAALVRTVDMELTSAVPPRTRLLVHCAGGAGRSGTFVAAHNAHTRLQSGAMRSRAAMTATVNDSILRLREQRHHMLVETSEQRQLIDHVLTLLLPLNRHDAGAP